MRRNILTYKAPPNNEGYDLICIHPDPRAKSKQIRVHVKSRYQTDSDRGFPVNEKSLDAFDYLIVVFLNVGYYYSSKKSTIDGEREPEFYTFPASFIRKHLNKSSSWQKVRTKGLDIDQYKNEQGYELIAQDLGIRYPTRSR